MDNFIVMVGISFALMTLFKLIGLYKGSKSIRKNDLFLGIIVSVLAIVAIDQLAIGLLFHYLGKKYFCILMGILFDALVIGVALRKTVKIQTTKEKLVDILKMLWCLGFFFVVFHVLSL